LKGLLKGFWWPFRLLKSVKYSWSYGLNEVCDSPLSKKLLSTMLVSKDNERVSRNRDVEAVRCRVNNGD